MSDKLLPCPFCGGVAEIEQCGTVRRSNIVACTYCGASLESGDVFDPAKSWNTRAAASTSDAIREECAKLISHCGECDCPRLSQAAIRATKSKGAGGGDASGI